LVLPVCIGVSGTAPPLPPLLLFFAANTVGIITTAETLLAVPTANVRTKMLTIKKIVVFIPFVH
jgi:hypothetical protein